MCANSKNNSFSVPPWVKTTDVAVWISDQFGDICYINSKAEKLFGCVASESLGKPCYRLVCGLDALGNHSCGADCPVLQQLKLKLPIEPLDIYITNAQGIEQRLHVLVISMQHPESNLYWLIHCALADNKKKGIEDYFHRVYTRSPHDIADYANLKNPMLSKREDQILQLLSQDKCMKEIAFELHLSYSTIRNHVHHILSKLKVHSIVEAIALNLLIKK